MGEREEWIELIREIKELELQMNRTLLAVKHAASIVPPHLLTKDSTKGEDNE